MRVVCGGVNELKHLKHMFQSLQGYLQGARNLHVIYNIIADIRNACKVNACYVGTQRGHLQKKM
jgi:hypothetical protein